MVGFTANDRTLCRHENGVSVLAQDVVGVVVDVKFGVGHIVDRADGDGQLGVGIRHFRQVHSVVGIGAIDARAVEEESKNVIVLGVDPSEVFVGAKDIIEPY